MNIDLRLRELAVEQAKLSTGIAALKKQGSDAFGSCLSRSRRQKGTNADSVDPDFADAICIDLVHENSGHYDDGFEHALDSDELCDNCRRGRELRSQRLALNIRRGVVRMCITKIGKRIINEQ